MEMHTEIGELCYEPFSGSGSQLVAAQQTGRRCYAIEKSPPFVAVALERLAAMGLQPELIRSMKRQLDGTWRGVRQPLVASEKVLRARWLEAEVLQLKRMGLAFEAIAEQITRVARNQAQPLTAFPEGVRFAVDFAISRQACHKAFKRALARQPALAAEEFRKLDTARCEELFLNLQPAIRKGNPRAIEAGVKVLRHTAQLNGYAAPQRHELTGKDGQPLTLVQLLEAIGPIR